MVAGAGSEATAESLCQRLSYLLGSQAFVEEMGTLGFWVADRHLCHYRGRNPGPQRAEPCFWITDPLGVLCPGLGTHAIRKP